MKLHMNPASIQPDLRSPLVVELAVRRRVSAPLPFGATVDELLLALRDSPTDLAKLVKTVHQRRRRVVAISPNAITRWNKDDPDSWTRVREWLTRRSDRVRPNEQARVPALHHIEGNRLGKIERDDLGVRVAHVDREQRAAHREALRVASPA